MDADEFIQTIPSAALNLLRLECQIAWDCMRGIMRLAKAGKIRRTNKSSTPNSEIRDYPSTDHPLVSMNLDDEEKLDREKTIGSKLVKRTIWLNQDIPEAP